jgi:carbonic anhydrase-like protein
MDGRIQEPVIKFIKDNYDVEFVDTVTEPGPNKILSEHHNKDLLYSILSRINISIEKHRSRLVFVSGHYDCAGNPVEEEIQKQQIKDSVQYLEKSYPGLKVIGLRIDDEWKVNRI